MYHFIVNPCSRTGKAAKVWVELEQVLKQKNVEYRVYFTERPGHATEISAAICRENPGEKHIITVGGDGTANEVINGFSDYSDIIFGCIPTGSGNDLVRGLGLPSDPLAVLDRILSGDNICPVDHGVLQYFDGTPDRRFDVSSGFGYDADVCFEVQVTPLKRVLNRLGLGKLCYYIVAAKQIFALKPKPATLLFDGERSVHYDRLLLCASMVQPYEGGGLKLAPSANNADRKLTLVIVHDVSKLKLFLVLPSVLISKHTGIRGVEIFDCDSVEITSDDARSLHTDGEPVGIKDHVRLSCTPDQIRMYL